MAAPPPQHRAHHHGLGAVWAPTTCSVSASWAQSRTMSRLAEKSLRVEKRYLGGGEDRTENSAPGARDTQHPWVPSPTPDLLSQEKSPLAAPTRSTTRARRARDGGRGPAPTGSPPSTRLWVPCASSRSLSVSVRRLVLASPASWGGGHGCCGTGGLQGSPGCPHVPIFTQPSVAPNPTSTRLRVPPHPAPPAQGAPVSPFHPT